MEVIIGIQHDLKNSLVFETVLKILMFFSSLLLYFIYSDPNTGSGILELVMYLYSLFTLPISLIASTVGIIRIIFHLLHHGKLSIKVSKKQEIELK